MFLFNSFFTTVSLIIIAEAKIVVQVQRSQGDTAACIKTIIDYYNIETVISVGPKHDHTLSYINFLVSKLKVPLYSFSFDLTNYHRPKSDYMNDKAIYFIHAVQLSSILETLESIGFWKHRRYLIIFGPKQVFENPQKVLQYFYKNTQFKTLNVALVVVREPHLDIEQVIAHNPFLNKTTIQQNCKRIVPDYFKNLHGYPLKVSYYKNTDYIKFIGTHEEDLDGIMMRTALKSMNAKLIIVRSSTRNGSIPIKNMINEVRRGETVAALNEYLLSRRFIKSHVDTEKLEYTYPRVKESIAILIPFNYESGQYRKLHLIGRTKILYTAAVLMIAFYLFSKFFKSNPLTITETYFIFLSLISGQSSPGAKIRSLGLRFMSLLLIFTMMNFLWSCLLPKDLTIAEKLKFYFLTIEDITYKTSFPIRLSPIVRPLLADVLSKDIYKHLNETRFNSTAVQASNHLLKNVPACKNEAYIILRTYGLLSVIQNYKDNKKCSIVMRADIMPTWLSYSFNYGSPFIIKINKILSGMNSAGLMLYFQKSTSVKMLIDDYFRPQYNALSYSFLEPIFNFLFYGYAGSFVVFTLELLVFMVKRKWSIQKMFSCTLNKL